MMNHMVTSVGMIAKRAMGDDTPVYDVPSWTWFIVLADFIVFLPLLFYTSYTLNKIFPALAMVEDENPPAYEPVSLNEDDASIPEEAGPLPPKALDGSPRSVSSSIRSMNRALYANGGWRAYARGFVCLFAHEIASMMLLGIFSGIFPRRLHILAPFALLIAHLALVQLSTAWVHIVIAPHNAAPFWRRLPAFKRTFDATARPVALFWLAKQLSQLIPFAMAWAIQLHLPKMDTDSPNKIPVINGVTVAKGIAVFVVGLLSAIFLVIPANVTLVRVQASLLPAEEDTIISFDRSFRGTVEPAIVGGTGYATMAAAWNTFSRAAWRRLVILYVKLFLVNIAAMALMAVVIVPEAFLIMSKSTLRENPRN